MADSDLSRTHPLTVVVRSVKSLAQTLFAFVALTLFGTAGGRSGWLAGLGIAGLIVLAALVSAGFSWLNWLYFRFGVVGHDLLILEGWLVKKRRAIPISRVQGIDIRADLVSRLLGLADVVVQTAGGGSGEAEARIGSIPLAQAEQLRSDLLHWRDTEKATEVGAAPAGGESSAGAVTAPTIVGADPVGRMSDLRGVFGGEEAAGAASEYEYHLPLSRLVVAGLTSNAVLVTLAAGVGLAGQAWEMFGGAATEATDALSTLALPATISLVVLGMVVVVGLSVAVVVARDFGFVARRVRDRIETEAGLVERRMTSMPIRRIQAVRIEQTPLRRLLGFTAVYADTAGFGRGEEQKSTTATAVLPLCRTAEVRPAMHELLPEAEQFPATSPVPRRAIRFYLTWPTAAAVAIAGSVLGVTSWFVASAGAPEEFTLFAPYAVFVSALLVGGVVALVRFAMWRSSAFGADERALAVQYGVLGAYRVRLPHSRIQSLAIRQTPFQKRAGLATIVVSSVSGSSATHYRVRNIEVSDAARIERWYSPDQSVPPRPAAAPSSV